MKRTPTPWTSEHVATADATKCNYSISLRERIDCALWATCIHLIVFSPLAPYCFFFYVAALQHSAPPEMLVAGHVTWPRAADFVIALRFFRDRSADRDVV